MAAFYEEERSSTSYNTDYLQQLKASQKFTVSKLAVEQANQDDVILTGEEAKKVTELLELVNTSNEAIPSNNIIHNCEDQHFFETAKRDTRDLLKDKDKGRLYVNLKRSENTTLLDLNEANDLSWEDELIQRGVISSKPVSCILAQTELKLQSGIFTASHKTRVLDKPSNDIDILDIINNIQTMVDKTKYSIEHHKRRELELQQQLNLSLQTQQQTQVKMDDSATKLAVIKVSLSMYGCYLVLSAFALLN
jgi:hypothetical protein